jgi:hypothetical protein
MIDRCYADALGIEAPAKSLHLSRAHFFRDAFGEALGFILTPDDCRATYAELIDKGVESVQEPTERFYGIDCAIRGPFGNQIRITQPAEGRIDVPEAASDRAGA